MSYDLFFTSPPPPDAPARFAEHFRERRDYKCGERQAWYENPDTGVYFSFDLLGDDDETPDAWASFNLNYFRSRIFACEAAIELEAFVAKFGDRVDDPQEDGMGKGVFSWEGFHRGWACGNSAARAIASSRSISAALVWPPEQLERIWCWNYARRDFQERIGDDIFAPRISFFRTNGKSVTASVWTDGIPVVLPETDMVIIYRDQLSPRAWYRRRSKTTAIVPLNLVFKKLEVRREESSLPHYFSAHTTVPDDLASWIKSLPLVDSLESIRMDGILDDEGA